MMMPVQPGPNYVHHFRLLEQIRECTDEQEKLRLCLEDVDIAEDFVRDWKIYEHERIHQRILYSIELGLQPPEIEAHNLPRYSSFLTLAKYYEKRGDYRAAIDICERALALGLTIENTKMGTAGRIERLRKKLEGASK